MPAYIVYKNDVFNIYSTVSDGFYFETGITEKELYRFIRMEQGETAVADLPDRIDRAKSQGSSSLLGHSFEELAECNVIGLSVEQCIKKYMTIAEWSTPMSMKEALRICVDQLKLLVDTEHIYDDETGKFLSFKMLDGMLK